MFLMALLIITKTWKQARCPSVGGRVNICAPSRQWDMIEHQKETSYQARERLGTLNGILKTYY